MIVLLSKYEINGVILRDPLGTVPELAHREFEHPPDDGFVGARHIAVWGNQL
jgi:hypothetical protein